MKALRFYSVFLASALLLCTVSCRRDPGKETQNTEHVLIPDTAEERIIRENEKSEMFTEKDLDASLPTDGNAVTLDGEKEPFRITAGGTWILSGTMNGTVEIEADKTLKILLIIREDLKLIPSDSLIITENDILVIESERITKE